MKNHPNPPLNLNAYDLNRQQVQIPIIQPFSESEAEKIIGMFDDADKIENDILIKAKQLDYPFMVHLLSLPAFSTSCWLQGVSVQRIQQDQVRPPMTEICLELTRTKDIMSGIIYIPYYSVLYLAVRGLDHPAIEIENNMLEQYAKKV
jgi:hypothetical protein